MNSLPEDPNGNSTGPDRSAETSSATPSGEHTRATTSAATRDAERLRMAMGRATPPAQAASKTTLREPAPIRAATPTPGGPAADAGGIETRLRPVAATGGAAASTHVVRDVERLQRLTQPSEVSPQAPIEATHPTHPPRSRTADADTQTTVPAPGYDSPRVASGAGTGKQIAAIVATVVLGTILGVLLFIEGGEIIGGLFAGEREELYENPAEVTDRLPADAPLESPRQLEAESAEAAEPVDEVAGTEALWEEVPPSMLPEEAAAESRRAEAPAPVSARAAADESAARAAGPRKPAEAVVVDVDLDQAKATARATKPAATGTVEKPQVRSVTAEAPEPTVAPISGTRQYTVQVRATTDQLEAKRIAQHLESIGMSNVKVLETEKNGQRYYRVRGGSHTSVDAALEAASKAGYEDVWVVPQ